MLLPCTPVIICNQLKHMLGRWKQKNTPTRTCPHHQEEVRCESADQATLAVKPVDADNKDDDKEKYDQDGDYDSCNRSATQAV